MMSENQDLINDNVQERLRDLEVQQQVMTAFFYAVIETHSSPAELKDRFVLASEHIIASSVHKPLPDAWLRQLNTYRNVLVQWCDKRIHQTK